MNSKNSKSLRSRGFLVQALSAMMLTAIATHAWSHEPEASDERRWIHVAAKNKIDRSAIVDAGMSIESLRSDSVWGFANPSAIERIRSQGYEILGNFSFETGRGGHQNMFGFPNTDDAYHTYDELIDELRMVTTANADISRLHSVGKTIEGRDIWAVHINTANASLVQARSAKPGVIFMGNHHAREHLSVELPLLLVKYLLENRRNPQVSKLLEARDIWIIPMVNPDGSEFDIATGTYRYWRKNRRSNKNGTFGVDLNRNYGFKWGTGGSDKDPSSDIYMGTAPFSEPETQTIRDFVKSQPNAKVLLTLHTYGELILYPWGHTYDSIGNARDLAVFEKMAKTMSGWNKYKPQQSSDLYIASGDTTDWAYGELGLFAFTFELSPGQWGGGGFYPGPKMIQKAFADNLRPFLYLMEVAADPYAVIDGRSRWLPHYTGESFSQNWLN